MNELPKTWEQAAAAEVEILLDTLIKKQKDYGHENIRWGGKIGVLIRAHDKMARIKNLLDSGRAPTNEPLVDSWLDLAGYAILGAMLEAGTFELPLEEDSDRTRTQESDRTGSEATVREPDHGEYDPSHIVHYFRSDLPG